MSISLTTATLRTAKTHLINADKTMARLIATNPPYKLVRQQPPLHVLAVSVINQQLSQQAAASITQRIEELIPAPFSATNILALPPQKLRAAGLSTKKVEYIRHLAVADSNNILTLSKLKKQSDESIIAQLTAIPGVGKWTVEMFLMFGLKRADIVSLGDAGLRRAAKLHYGKRFTGDDATILEKASARWQPWRTVACWHLWQSLK